MNWWSCLPTLHPLLCDVHLPNVDNVAVFAYQSCELVAVVTTLLYLHCQPNQISDSAVEIKKIFCLSQKNIAETHTEAEWCFVCMPCMHTCVFMRILVYLFVGVCVYLWLYLCTCVCAPLFMCILVFMCVGVHVHIYLHVCVHMRLYVCESVCACLCTCVYVCIRSGSGGFTPSPRG